MDADEIDLEILSILLRQARTSKSEIARRIGIAQSAISERVKKLEESGLLKGYEARLSASDLGIKLLAYIFVTERKPVGAVDTGACLSNVTGVEEVHKIAGEDCFLVKIRATDTMELGRILDAEINPIKTVAGTRTTIVLRTVKEDVALGGIPMFREPGWMPRGL